MAAARRWTAGPAPIGRGPGPGEEPGRHPGTLRCNRGAGVAPNMAAQPAMKRPTLARLTQMGTPPRAMRRSAGDTAACDLGSPGGGRRRRGGRYIFVAGKSPAPGNGPEPRYGRSDGDGNVGGRDRTEHVLSSKPQLETPAGPVVKVAPPGPSPVTPAKPTTGKGGTASAPRCREALEPR
eukprot:gene17344-biopygen12871